MSRNMEAAFVGAVAMVVGLAVVPFSAAQTEPTFEISDPVVLFEDLITKEAGIAVNTNTPEILMTTFDTMPIGDQVDPISGELPMIALYGCFYDPITLEKSGEPFLIFGNPYGTGMETNDVKYSPVTNQYVVAAKADNFGENGRNVPLVAIVNAGEAVSAGESPVAKAFAYDTGTDQN